MRRPDLAPAWYAGFGEAATIFVGLLMLLPEASRGAAAGAWPTASRAALDAVRLDPLALDPADMGRITLAAALAVALGIISAGIGMYRPSVLRHLRALALTAVAAAAIALPVTVAICVALGPDLGGDVAPYLPLVARVLLVWLLCLCLTRAVIGIGVPLGLFSRRVLVVGGEPAAASLRQHCSEEFVVSGLPSPEAARGPAGPGRVWAVIVGGEASDAAALRPGAGTGDDDRSAGLRVLSRDAFFERALRRIDVGAGRPGDFDATETRATRTADRVRRVADIVGSLVLLVLLLPLMLVTALAIRLTSPGPALFRQERVGLHGRPFMLLKFRSMRADAEAGGRPVWATQRDPRVTPIGGFIRRVRIDELPQLINVLRGEMSFIGPRPERPYFVRQLADEIPGYNERHRVKPGISGWAQVNYRYGASVEDGRIKLSYDLYYVKHRSLALDLEIALATLRVVLLQEGSR
ncbi:exopolysaccharide biosynthesis polyprenyl glycosylphosphotransferase [Acidisphaera rubrifaciens]|uniref:Exopolysaccharide biosynthesis polyprenyl glycosylphosphotransferase n=1 Tax=Acidisphaera rubrifaciens HS-AP3 TaxID=1231350 RepID=A0A0D6P6B3_9PROT|nr:exopolysaccharide biosynthesis polyprenyl glycosylphosphotransferase [Acidisphaera rubrifaciens]GAN76738.1 exopolysaccharide biosynthesis polyprenyl glycosylphosphotransferase [Acidisphaera rubrifaciens HS-AP3]